MLDPEMLKAIEILRREPDAQVKAASEFLGHKDAQDVVRMLLHPSPRFRRMGQTFFEVTTTGILEAMVIEIAATDTLAGDE